MKIKIGFAICGSFCTHEQILWQVEKLTEKYDIVPILSPASATQDTRFGTAENLKNQLIKLTGNEIVDSLQLAEPLGPKGVIELLVIAPCTGNTLAKLANAITDNAVTMVAKALSRNNKPVVVGISTNDGLGLSIQNLAKLMQTKNYYFVPFGQDDPTKKPKSLISDYEKIDKAIEGALKGEQVQPILIGR